MRKLSNSTPTVINTELRPFDESFRIDANGQLEQWFYDNTSQYVPNRTVTVLTLTPVLSVYDADTDKSYTTASTQGEEDYIAFYYLQWYVNEYNGTTYQETLITSSADGAGVNYFTQGNNLIVKKNVSYAHAVTIRCVATYIDPRDAGITYSVEDSVILSCSRDATVVLPEVAIVSPSARAFNPLVDGYTTENGVEVQNTEYEFEGTVTNSPAVEHVTSSDLAEYKVDGWGTEEIESASGSCSPTLTIRYPDGSIETDARFMYRKTADGNKLNMGGKVISWNQLVRNGDFSNGTSNWNYNSTVDTMSVSEGKLLCTTTAANANVYVTTGLSTVVGHKYYAVATLKSSIATGASRFTTNTSPNVGGRYSFSLQANVEKRVATIIEQTTAGTLFGIYHNFSTSAPPPVGSTLLIDDVMLIDLTTIYGSGKEPTSVAQFESDYQMWFGKQLTYEPYDAGSQRQTLAPQNAFITNIKGNTVPWNQLVTPAATTVRGITTTVSNGVITINGTSSPNSGGRTTPLTTTNPKVFANHKYYICTPTRLSGTVIQWYLSNASTSAIVVNVPEGRNIVTVTTTATCIFGGNFDGDSSFNYSGYIQIIDLSLIYGDRKEPTTVAAFEADFLKWFGKPLTYETYDAGSLKTVKMVSMKTVGFNAADYDEMKVGSDNYAYSYNGYYCKSFKLLPNTTYRIRKKASSYGSVVLLINSDSAINSGNYFDTRSSSSFSKDYTTNSSGLLYVGVVSGTSTQVKARLEEIDLQIYLINDDSRNGHYESHWHNTSMLNVTELKGRVVTNGQATGNLVTIFPDGMKGILNTRDEIITQNGKIYAIKRIGSVNLGTYDWTYNSNYNMFYRGYVGAANAPQSTVCSKYYPMSSGRKAYNCIWNGYFLNPNSINIVDTSTTDPAVLKAKLNGVICHYPLSTAVKYEIDEIQSPFIFKWFGINSSGQEVDATTMPWYKEGQDTSKLKVDAMYGENINVVLRCTKGAGLNELSPSKAFASLSWRVPEIDCHVISYNGGAVRVGDDNDELTMRFGTTINVRGQVLSEARRNAHLRLNWKYRHSNSPEENDVGWDNEIEIPNNNLIHVRGTGGGTLASTLVYPYVYLLGPWKPATSTTTPYTKPTTTKDGASYERTID